MFERWITRGHDRERLESSPLCCQLSLFATTLESEGYAPLTLRRYLFAAEAFSRWLVRRGWRLADIDKSKLQLYQAGLRRHRLRGRPCSGQREVFLTARAPHRPLKLSGSWPAGQREDRIIRRHVPRAVADLANALCIIYPRGDRGRRQRGVRTGS